MTAMVGYKYKIYDARKKLFVPRVVRRLLIARSHHGQEFQRLTKDFCFPSTDYTVIIRPQVVPRVQFRPGTFSIAAVFEADVDFPNEVGEYDSSLLLLVSFLFSFRS